MLIIVLAFGIKFLYDAVSSDGPSRKLLLIILTIGSLIIALVLINLISTVVHEWLSSRVSERFLVGIKNIKRILNVLCLIALPFLVYFSYQQGNYSFIILGVVILMEMNKKKRNEVENS